MQLKTPVFRVSYPNVFKPKLNELNGKLQYSVQALFPKGEELKELKEAIKKEIIATWGPDEKKWPKGLKLPIKKQGKEVDGKMVYPSGHEEGGLLLDLKSEQRPQVVDQQVQEIINPSDFYAGVYARASITVKSFNHPASKGVSIYLGNLQKVKDGDSLGSRKKAQEDFAPIETDGEATSLFD